MIWLHGLGADGSDFEPIVPQLDLRIPVRFVFPHAPVRPVTINGGAEMRAWYDIDPRAPLAGSDDIAGVMALSTYVHDHEHLAERVSFASIDVPIFMAHGLADPMIPIARAVTSREALAALNYRVEWREYGMGHQVCHAEIVDIGRWLSERFAP